VDVAVADHEDVLACSLMPTAQRDALPSQRREPGVIAHGRVTAPLLAGGSAVVNSGCTRPEAALPRPTGRRPRRVAPDQPGNGSGVRSPGA
jgi:hypothetical protein